jgi:hypothetical protein
MLTARDSALEIGDLVRLEFSDARYLNCEYIVLDQSDNFLYLVEPGAAWEAAHVHCVSKDECQVVNVRRDDALILSTVAALQRFHLIPAEERDPEIGDDCYDKAHHVASMLLSMMEECQSEDEDEEECRELTFNSADEFFGFLHSVTQRLNQDIAKALQSVGAAR